VFLRPPILSSIFPRAWKWAATSGVSPKRQTLFAQTWDALSGTGNRKEQEKTAFIAFITFIVDSAIPLRDIYRCKKLN